MSVEANKTYQLNSARKQNDNCSKWFLCITACLSMMLDIGFMFSFGTLYVDIMATFGTGRSTAAMVQSILMAVRFGSGMISGTVVQKFGTLYAGVFGSCLASTGLVMSYFAPSIAMLDITIGLVLAFGSSCLYIASSMTIGQQFSSERRHILMSVQSAAGGVGGMMFPFILKYLSENFGLRGSLLLVGGIYLQILPAALLWKDAKYKNKDLLRKSSIENAIDDKESEGHSSLRSNKTVTKGTAVKCEEMYTDATSSTGITNSCDVITAREAAITDTTPLIKGKSELGQKMYIDKKKVDVGVGIHQDEKNTKEPVSKCLKALVCNPSFVLFAIGLAIAYPALGILFIFVVDLFLDTGLTESDATFGLLLVHLFSIFGRLLPGLILQSKHVPALFVPICASIVTSAVMAALVVVDGLSEHLVLLSLIGVPYGVFVSVFSVTTLKLVGIEKLPNAIGIHFTLNGIGSALAGPISGWLRDYTGSYTYPFWIASGVILVGAIFFTVALQINKKKNNTVTERTPLLRDVTFRLESSTIF